MNADPEIRGERIPEAPSDSQRDEVATKAARLIDAAGDDAIKNFIKGLTRKLIENPKAEGAVLKALRDDLLAVPTTASSKAPMNLLSDGESEDESHLFASQQQPVAGETGME